MPRNEQRPITYTRHALHRMAQRQVTADEVERTIRHGTWRPDVNGWVAQATVNGRALEVPFRETTDGAIEVLLVVTVIDAQRRW